MDICAIIRLRERDNKARARQGGRQANKRLNHMLLNIDQLLLNIDRYLNRGSPRLKVLQFPRRRQILERFVLLFLLHGLVDIGFR